MKGSAQLRAYLRARRGGTSSEDAAELAGFTLAEARLTDADEAKGLLADIDTETPEAAGIAATPEETTKMDAIVQDEAPADDVIEATVPEFGLPELCAGTLRGDVRDALLSWFKAKPKAWSEMGEHEQRELAAAADSAAYNLVREVCRHVAAAERPCIVAKLVEYREKDGVEAKLKLASKGEIVAALHEACGREVLIVTSGEEEFLGEAGPAEIDVEEPELPVTGEEYLDQ